MSIKTLYQATQTFQRPDRGDWYELYAEAVTEAANQFLSQVSSSFKKKGKLEPDELLKLENNFHQHFASSAQNCGLCAFVDHDQLDSAGRARVLWTVSFNMPSMKKGLAAQFKTLDFESIPDASGHFDIHALGIHKVNGNVLSAVGYQTHHFKFNYVAFKVTQIRVYDIAGKATRKWVQMCLQNKYQCTDVKIYGQKGEDHFTLIHPNSESHREQVVSKEYEISEDIVFWATESFLDSQEYDAFAAQFEKDRLHLKLPVAVEIEAPKVRQRL